MEYGSLRKGTGGKLFPENPVQLIHGDLSEIYESKEVGFIKTGIGYWRLGIPFCL